MQPHHRQAAHEQGNRGGERADLVPGEAGEENSAKPFEGGEGGSQREEPAHPIAPDEARDRCGQPVIDREHHRQAEDGEGQRPEEGVAADEHRRAEPPEPAEEVAEAEEPADPEGRERASNRARARHATGPVEKPDQDREGDESHGRNVDRRQTQRRQKAGGEGERRPSPAMEKHDPSGQSFQVARLLYPGAGRGASPPWAHPPGS